MKPPILLLLALMSVHAADVLHMFKAGGSSIDSTRLLGNSIIIASLEEVSTRLK